ncbi:MAG: ABC transporter ATP-binding protein [Chloroflexi bacterium]|nr:MAG: ABC transporter ATP-binding protein [Chloroflexota bacterium]
MGRVEYDDVWKQFPTRDAPAVRGLTLDVADGEFLVLLGPSGCGKTTALRMLAGLEHPDRGDIRIEGRSVLRLEPKDRNVALVFQSYALYPHMSVRGNIEYPLRVRNIAPAERERKVERAADLLRIQHLLPRRPGQLSGGEQQRVALARAIVREPQVFLMDEPLSNLDAKLRTHTRTELKALQQQLGVTTIFVTHDQAEAMTMADRIAVLDAGVLQQLGTPDNVYQRPANLFVAQFIGSPPMNILDATRDGEALVVAGGWRIAAPHRLDGARAVKVGLRPEAIDLAMAGGDDGQPAEVLVSEPLGSEVIVNVKLADVLLKVRTAPDVRPDPGARVYLRARHDGVRVFDGTTGAALN